MRILLLVFCLIASTVVVAQKVEKHFWYDKQHEDMHRAKKAIAWSDQYVESEERELDEYIHNHFLTGDDIKDSIIFFKIKREYHHGVGNVIGEMYVQLKLLTLYHEYIPSEDLEPLNRKLAESFELLGDYVLAQAFFKRALDYKNGNFKPYLLAKLGSCYIQLGDLDSAKLYYIKASNMAENNFDRIAHINSVGYVCYLKGEYDEAKQKYYEGLKRFSLDKIIDSIQYHIIQSNIGSLEISMGRREEGVERIERIQKSGSFSELDWFQHEIYLKLTRAYIDQGRCGAAQQALSKLKEVLPDNVYHDSYVDYYKLKLKLDFSCHSSVDAKKTFELLERKKEEIEAFRQKQLMKAGQLQYTVYTDRINLVSSNLELRQESEANLEVSNSRLMRLVIISVILIIIIVMAMTTWFIFKRRQANRKEAMQELKKDLDVEKERASQLEFEIAEKELENRKLELKRMLGSVDRNSTLFREVSSRLEVLRSKKGDLSEDIGQLVQFIRLMSKSDEINDLLKRNSDLVDESFKLKIEERFPKLSKSEVQLVILIRLELSTKEIAQLKNVEPSSIRIFKHRLKQKLGLAKEDDLYAFIRQLNALSK